MTFDSEKFKQVLGCWATGVTIVTARHEGQIHGMTVSAFNEVSLDPPLQGLSAASVATPAHLNPEHVLTQESPAPSLDASTPPAL